MKILPGTRAKNFDEAVGLALADAGAIGISTKVIGQFVSLVDTMRLRSDTEKAITSTIRNRYRGKTSWHDSRWHVPIPNLRYDARDVPQLIIEVHIHLVAVAEVDTSHDFFTLTLLGSVGQPETMVIPMVFLQAILADDLGRFAVMVRSATHTTWEVPGAKPVQLPHSFINHLTATLKRQTVVDWLQSFGAQGQNVAPLVSGALLGLQLSRTSSAEPAPLEKQPVTTERLISIMEGLAYSVKEAKEMVSYAAPYLRAEHTLEEATRIVLQQAGKGE